MCSSFACIQLTLCPWLWHFEPQVSRFLTGKRACEEDAGEGCALRLKWVRGADSTGIALESFELIDNDLSAPPLPAGQGELNIEAALLLASLPDMPKQLTVTANVPLPAERVDDLGRDLPAESRSPVASPDLG